MSNKKASVLIISLWILAILVVFAVGLGHRASINLRLSRYQRDRLKATYLAKAGINRAILELENDENNYDSLNETWSTGVDANNNHIFENIELKEKSGETFNVKVTDEESKLNINKLTEDQLEKLFIHTGFESDASGLATTIYEWISSEEETGEQKGIFKNAPLKRIEELLVVLEYFYEQSGKDKKASQAEAQKIYNEIIKDFITVYNDLKVNLNTASSDVLKILMLNLSFNQEQIDGLINIIDDFRKNNGIFDQENSDDIINKLALNVGAQKEIIKQLVSGNLITVNSGYFKIESTGRVGQISKEITAIYNRDNAGVIVSWHEN